MSSTSMAMLCGMIALAAGGIMAGRFRRQWSLTVLGDAAAGMLGGKLGSELWSMIGIAAQSGYGLSFWDITGGFLAGLIGGLVLLAVVFQLRNIFAP